MALVEGEFLLKKFAINKFEMLPAGLSGKP
jgi:hypothetical protein